MQLDTATHDELQDGDPRLRLISLLDAAAAADLPPIFAVAAPLYDRDAAVFVALGHDLARRGLCEEALAAFETALTFAPEAAVLHEAGGALHTLAVAAPGSAPTTLRAAAAPAGLRFTPTTLLN